MGTKNDPGPFPCYLNADPDEPTFTLCSTDPDAPALVREWAHRYLRRKRGGSDDDPDRTWRKYMEALSVADRMEHWRVEHEEAQPGYLALCHPHTYDVLPWSALEEWVEQNGGMRITGFNNRHAPIPFDHLHIHEVNVNFDNSHIGNRLKAKVGRFWYVYPVGYRDDLGYRLIHNAIFAIRFMEE